MKCVDRNSILRARGRKKKIVVVLDVSFSVG